MTERPSFAISRLDYELPRELIAQQPLPERSASRMLVIDGPGGTYQDSVFSELVSLIPEGALIVMNNSRVIPARLFGHRQTGGRIEVLFSRWLGSGECIAVIGSSTKLPAGEDVELPWGWTCELLEPKARDGSRVKYIDSGGEPASLDSLMAYLGKHGITPLPPYIKRPAEVQHNAQRTAADRLRYQTVYADHNGSIAAPTAGLHFDEAMLDQLKAAGREIAYVTLHVGLGTFAPVRVDDLADHEMHEEVYTVDERTAGAYRDALDTGRPVVAVGTTSLRVLHTIKQQDDHADANHLPEPQMGASATLAVAAAPQHAQLTGATRAFIYPGCDTTACDILLTNFHLPCSTLLALVYSFGGEDLLHSAYEHAVDQSYRFFSYGDCMLIVRKD